MVLRILNIEEHQSCMFGSKVTKRLPNVFIHDFFLLLFWKTFTVNNGRVSWKNSVAVDVSDRWKVTCEM